MLPLIAALALAQDFQSWNELDLTANWRKIDFLIPVVERPHLFATGITADIPLPGKLTLTGGYLFADLTQHSLPVHIPLIALTKRFHFLSDRNRFEKLIGYPTAPVRYRNRLLADIPLRRYHVFSSDEVYFNLSNQTWNQNRFQIGAGARFNHHLSFDVYYLHRNLSTHVLGTTLKVKLNDK